MANEEYSDDEELDEGEDVGDEDDEGEGGYVYTPNDNLLSALARQWGSAPWYVSSFLVHMVIMALLILFAPEAKVQAKQALVVKGEVIDDVKVEEVEVKPEEKVVEDTKTDDVNVTVNNDVKIADVVVDPTVSVEESSETADATTFNEGEADSTEASTMGLVANRSAGGSKGVGKFGNRSGTGRSKGNKAGGITKTSQQALEDGLEWLARNQDPAGHWDCARFEGGPGYNISVSAMAQLAFLGAGNSTVVGPYRKNVRAAQSFLLTKFDPNTGRLGAFRYEAAITMMAMAESWAMSEDKSLADIVQAQVKDAIKYQNANGGWGYTIDADAVKSHVDTSVSGWWMMGMKSAKIAGADVTEASWSKALSYFKGVTKKNSDGTVSSGYVGAGTDHNMTAVGLTCLQFLGLAREDALVKGQADYFLKRPEIMINPKCAINSPYYGWYYQALGIYQMGTKSEYWKKFSPTMQSVITQIQEKSGTDKGSWPPLIPWNKEVGHFEKQVGRVGTTSIGCLIMEVCFRYGDAHATTH